LNATMRQSSESAAARATFIYDEVLMGLRGR
jgi:hypothetical protein